MVKDRRPVSTGLRRTPGKPAVVRVERAELPAAHDLINNPIGVGQEPLISAKGKDGDSREGHRVLDISVGAYLSRKDVVELIHPTGFGVVIGRPTIARDPDPDDNALAWV